MPLSVNSGTKPAMMIAAANRIDWFTSVAAFAMTANLPRKRVLARTTCSSAPPARRVSTLSLKCRKMFSTMMTVASTIRPKSMAPTDSRLADSPRNSIRQIANASAKGMVQATITALRRLPRKAHCSRKISRIPASTLCSTVPVVSLIRSERS